MSELEPPETGGGGVSVFEILPSTPVGDSSARLGRLALPGRTPIDTPGYVAVSSRGGIPHLTPDVINRHTDIAGSYMALEDFIEKSSKRKSPAIYGLAPQDGQRPLHLYTATRPDMLTILAPRRNPAVVAPMGNGQKHLTVFPSTGFESLTCDSYFSAVRKVLPDIVIPMADLTFGDSVPSGKRQRRMAERTEEWIEAFFQHFDVETVLRPHGLHVFAPLLTVPYPMQWEYMCRLAEDHAGSLSGLAVYDVDILADIDNHAALVDLPRMSLDSPSSPHAYLRQIRLGVDVFAAPLVNFISDAGLALTFTFPAQAKTAGVRPLGIDMSSAEHQASVTPLLEGCGCYACTQHHRAYLQHLLNAKEMLGWVLLQIHNHHVMSRFFAGVRAAIADGSFEVEADAFARAYEPDLPTGSGTRPRARGYHFKSEGGDPKRNKAPWIKLEDDEAAVDKALAGEAAGLAVTGASAPGGTETPVVPEGNAAALAEGGFAQIDTSRR